MIIECSSCNSRFRLDASRITGRGARVRCRKCGEAITVLKDEADIREETGAAAPALQDEGLDLRSILRESMEAPLPAAPPEAAPAGSDAPPSGFDGMRADAAPAAQPARADAAAAAGQTVNFEPEEEITFLPTGQKDAQVGKPAGAATPRDEPAPPAAQAPAEPAPSSEFVMSTSDALDFLKADYEKEGQKAALDISGSLRIAPSPGTDEVKVAPPLGTQRPMPPPVEAPSRTDAIQSEIAGLASAGAMGAAAADARGGTGAAPKPPETAPPRARTAAPPPPPPPREAPASRPSPAVRRPPARKGAPLKRGQGSQLVRPSVVLLLLLFFALAGGGAYLGFTSDGQKVLRGLVPQIESLWLGGGKPGSRYEVGNLVGYYEGNAAAGRLFVVKGQVTNEGQLRKTGVRVYAALLDAQSRKVAEKTVYAGNIMGNDALRKAPKEKIEAAMSNPMGGGLANIDIPPGKSVPFMVVFFDAPDGIDSYRLEPKDVD